MVKELVEPVVEVVTEKVDELEVVATALIKLAGRVRLNWLLLMEALNRLPEVEVLTEVTMLPMVKLEEDKFLLASVTTKEEAERVAMLMLPAGVIWKKEDPEVEATAKIGKLWEPEEATT